MAAKKDEQQPVEQQPVEPYGVTRLQAWPKPIRR